jgi:hypothetical protein
MHDETPVLKAAPSKSSPLELVQPRSALVARGVVPRAYPLWRPNGVRAPQRVDARVRRAHED